MCVAAIHCGHAPRVCECVRSLRPPLLVVCARRGEASFWDVNVKRHAAHETGMLCINAPEGCCGKAGTGASSVGVVFSVFSHTFAHATKNAPKKKPRQVFFETESPAFGFALWLSAVRGMRITHSLHAFLRPPPPTPTPGTDHGARTARRAPLSGLHISTQCPVELLFTAAHIPSRTRMLAVHLCTTSQ